MNWSTQAAFVLLLFALMGSAFAAMRGVPTELRARVIAGFMFIGATLVIGLRVAAVIFSKILSDRD